ncbi:hypothetical protein AB0H76_31595 [Nocardia sp. NPDC050712]|uniref:hypothetical protein n=1 Tax=Nocardia sp. NPDC050712 TaxID=3155518 RepID=UPI0033E12C6B
MDSTVEYNKPNSLQALGLDPATMANPQSNSAAENDKKVQQDPVLSTIVKPQPAKPSSLQAVGIDPPSVAPKPIPQQPKEPQKPVSPSVAAMYPGLLGPADSATSASPGAMGLPDTLALVKNGAPKPGQTVTLPSGTTIDYEGVRLSNGLTGLQSTMNVPGMDQPLVSRPQARYSPERLAGLFATDDAYTAEQRDRDLALLNGPRKMGPYTAGALASEAAAKAAASQRLNAHWNQSGLVRGPDGATVLPRPGYSPVQLANDLNLASTTGVLDEASERLRQDARERLDKFAYTKQDQDDDQFAAQYQYLPFDDPRRQAEVQRFVESGLTPAQAQSVVWRNAYDARNRLNQAGIPLLDRAQAEQLENTPRLYATDPRRPLVADNSPYEGKPHRLNETDFRNFLGEMTGLKDLQEGLYNGDPGQVAWGSAMTALTFTPGVFGKPLMAMFGKIGRWADDIPPAVAGPATNGLLHGLGAGGGTADNLAPLLRNIDPPTPTLHVPRSNDPLPASWDGAVAVPGKPKPTPDAGLPESVPNMGHGPVPEAPRRLPGDGPAVSPWRQPPPNIDRPWDPDYMPFFNNHGPFNQKPGWYKRFGRSDEPGAHNGPRQNSTRPTPDGDPAPYTGPSKDAPPGVMPVGVREVGEGAAMRWYSDISKGYVTMPGWAKVPPSKYVKSQYTPEQQFSLTSGARSKIDEVQAARDAQDLVVDGLRSERDDIAGELGLQPDKLTEKYLNEQMATLERKYSSAEIGRLEAAMSAVNKAEYQANKLTETMGNIAARDYIHQMGGEVITGLDDALTGSGKLDVVGIVNGKLVVVEAKGGGAQLGTRWVDGDPGQLIRVQQGTPQYLKWMLDNDPDLVKALKDRGLLEAVRNGEMDVVYDMIRYNPKVGQPQWSRFNIEDSPAVPPEAIRQLGQPGAVTPAVAAAPAADIAAPLQTAWLESATNSLLATLNTQAALTVSLLGAATGVVAGVARNSTRTDQSLTVNISAANLPSEDNGDSELFHWLTYGSGIRG